MGRNQLKPIQLSHSKSTTPTQAPTVQKATTDRAKPSREAPKSTQISLKPQLPKPFVESSKASTEKSRAELLAAWKATKQTNSSKPAKQVQPAVGTPVKHANMSLITLQISTAKSFALEDNLPLARRQLEDMIEKDPLDIYLQKEGKESLKRCFSSAPSLFTFSEYWCTRSLIEERSGNLELAAIMIDLAEKAKSKPMKPLLERIQGLVLAIKVKTANIRVDPEALADEQFLSNISKAISLIVSFSILAPKYKEQLTNINLRITEMKISGLSLLESDESEQVSAKSVKTNQPLPTEFLPETKIVENKKSTSSGKRTDSVKPTIFQNTKKNPVKQEKVEFPSEKPTRAKSTIPDSRKLDRPNPVSKAPVVPLKPVIKSKPIPDPSAKKPSTKPIQETKKVETKPTIQASLKHAPKSTKPNIPLPVESKKEIKAATTARKLDTMEESNKASMKQTSGNIYDELREQQRVYSAPVPQTLMEPSEEEILDSDSETSDAASPQVSESMKMLIQRTNELSVNEPAAPAPNSFVQDESSEEELLSESEEQAAEQDIKTEKSEEILYDSDGDEIILLSDDEEEEAEIENIAQPVQIKQEKVEEQLNNEESQELLNSEEELLDSDEEILLDDEEELLDDEEEEIQQDSKVIEELRNSPFNKMVDRMTSAKTPSPQSQIKKKQKRRSSFFNMTQSPFRKLGGPERVKPTQEHIQIQQETSKDTTIARYRRESILQKVSITDFVDDLFSDEELLSDSEEEKEIPEVKTYVRHSVQPPVKRELPSRKTKSKSIYGAKSRR